MMLPLTHLLAEGPSACVIARWNGGDVDLGMFRAAVGRHARQLRRLACRRGILMTHDAYCGAIGLFALLQAGIDIVMPQNAQTGTLSSLAAADDLVVTDIERSGIRNCYLLQVNNDDEDSAEPRQPLSPELPITFFTSGSTGGAKPVRKTLADLQAEASAIDQVLGSIVPAAADIVSTVSHQHVYGLAFRLCWPLASGRPFAAATHEIWETALADLRPGAALISSPAHLERLGGLDPVEIACRPSLVLSAGAPLAESAVAQARSVFGVAPTEIFGSTETGAVACRSRGNDDPPWQPLPGLSVTRSEDGRMVVRGGHIPAPGEHAGADLVELLGDGSFRFHGRADRVVKVEGKRVSLPDVENRLRELPWIETAAAVPLGDPPTRFGAVAVLTQAGAEKLATLGAFRFGRMLRRELAAKQEPAGLPRQWRFVKRLPTKALGKLHHAELAALFEPTAPVRPTEPEICAERPTIDGIELDLRIPPDLAQLEGHFPGHPVLAGVVQIDWAVTLAARYLRLPVASAQNFQVKFRTVTTPEMAITLTLRHLQSRQRLSFEYRTGTRLLTSGTIALEVA